MYLRIIAGKSRHAEVLYLQGRLIYGPECEAFLARCAETIGRGMALVLDLTRLNAIDSAGIGSMVRVLTSARNRGADVVLIAPQERAAHSLKLTRVLSVFDVYQQVEDALDAIAATKAQKTSTAASTSRRSAQA